MVLGWPYRSIQISEQLLAFIYVDHNRMDFERRPLLAENDDADADDALIQEPGSDEGFVSRLLGEPLTELARLLLFTSVGLLLLASVFVGLFAGAEHRLSVMKHMQTSTTTESVTTTRLVTVTSTLTAIVSTTRPTTTMTSIIPPPTHNPEPASAQLLLLCVRWGS